MKTLLAIVIVVAAIFFVAPISCAEEEQQVDHTIRMVKIVVELIGDAHTVVICDFRLPEGMKVTKVLIGDSNRLGQLWNSAMFPRKTILVYERVNDHLGGGSSTLMATGHFELDQSKKFVMLESIVRGEANPKNDLIPIDDIMQELANKEKKNKSEQATPSKPSD